MLVYDISNTDVCKYFIRTIKLVRYEIVEVLQYVTFYFDRYRYEWDLQDVELVEMNRNVDGSTLEWTEYFGVKKISFSEEEQRFISFTEEEIETYYVEKNCEKYYEMLHPLAGYGKEDIAANMEYEDCTLDALIPLDIITELELNEMEDAEGFKQEIRNKGYEVDEVAAGEYIIVMYRNGERILRTIQRVYIISDNQILFAPT